MRNEVKSNQSVERVFRILELLSRNVNPMRLHSIAKELEMSPSTALRFLNTLIQLGYVYLQSDTQRYSLTIKLANIAKHMDLEACLRDVAHPVMHDLAILFNETVCLAVERNFEVVYIDVVQGAEAHVRSEARVGNASYMHCTGIGKLLLTNYSETQLAYFVERKGLVKHTEKTITTLAGLMKEIETVKRLGYAFDNEECEIGGRCIAAPIYDHMGKVVAGISVSGTVFHLNDDMIEQYRDTFLEMVADISYKLGYRETEEQAASV